MNILILGSGGLLGKYLVKTLGMKRKIFATTHKELNILDSDSYYNFIKKNKIDVTINCAALTNIYKCENNKEEALKINAYAPAKLSLISKDLNVKFIHFSTGFVFDGRKESEYCEDDIPSPQTLYGYSKYRGEEMIIKENQNSLIIRTDEIFGYADFVPGHNVIGFTIKHILEDKPVALYDIYTSPTYALDLSKKIDEIFQKNIDIDGILHIVNRGKFTYIQVAKMINKILKKDIEINVRNDELNKNLPKNCSMKSIRLNSLNLEELPDFEDALKRCIKEFL